MNPLARLPLCPLTVTVTVTAPALPAGVVAVICRAVHHHHVRRRRRSPNVTVAPAAKFVPVIVTAVPPAVDPLFGTHTAHRRRHNVGEPIGQAPALPARPSPSPSPLPHCPPASSP